MAPPVRKIEYFNITVKDQPGESFKVLTYLKDLGVNLRAFSAIPMGANTVLFTVFPEDPAKLSQEMRYSGKILEGPHYAVLVQGEDEVGALTEIHQKLYDADVNVSAANGVSTGKGDFGYIIYIRSDEFEKAAAALGI